MIKHLWRKTLKTTEPSHSHHLAWEHLSSCIFECWLKRVCRESRGLPGISSDYVCVCCTGLKYLLEALRCGCHFDPWRWIFLRWSRSRSQTGTAETCSQKSRTLPGRREEEKKCKINNFYQFFVRPRACLRNHMIQGLKAWFSCKALGRMA